MSLERADEVVKGLWKRDAKAWEIYWVPVFHRFARHLVLDSGVSPGQIVLDIGTGTGVAALESARRARPNGFVLAIDRLQQMITLAEEKAAKRGVRNTFFLQMDSRHLLFPDGMFDVVTSNCGILSVGFHQTAAEVYRVLRNGGVFVYNDWRLKDVPPHRTFGKILQQYRTNKPSKTLSIQRTSLATLDRFANRKMTLRTQIRELKRSGFRKIELKPRNYRITLPGIEAYLAMRLKRATVKQELKELSPAERRKLMSAFREGLKSFVRGGRFVLDWRVTFIRATK